MPKEVAARPRPTSQTGTEKILLVEDEPEVRAFSKRVLRGLGYDVTEAADGVAALEILRQPDRHFDLLFTDVVLPNGMDGSALATEAVALLPNLKVLFATGTRATRFCTEAGSSPASSS